MNIEEYPSSMHYHSRYICELVKYFVPHGIGVEVGTYKGETSKSLLGFTEIKHLYMVDPWLRDFDVTNVLYTGKGNPDSDYREVTEFFKENFPDRSTIIRKKSIDGADDIDIQVDFIFIDANHTYEAVMEDLTTWVPKVRSGGLVLGHDWWGRFPGVAKAVMAFCQKYDPFRPPVKPSDLPDHYILAPGSGKPIVMKSWPLGHLWWAIKK